MAERPGGRPEAGGEYGRRREGVAGRRQLGGARGAAADAVDGRQRRGRVVRVERDDDLDVLGGVRSLGGVLSAAGGGGAATQRVGGASRLGRRVVGARRLRVGVGLERGGRVRRTAADRACGAAAGRVRRVEHGRQAVGARHAEQRARAGRTAAEHTLHQPASQPHHNVARLHCMLLHAFEQRQTNELAATRYTKLHA